MATPTAQDRADELVEIVGPRVFNFVQQVLDAAPPETRRAVALVLAASMHSAAGDLAEQAGVSFEEAARVAIDLVGHSYGVCTEAQITRVAPPAKGSA